MTLEMISPGSAFATLPRKSFGKQLTVALALKMDAEFALLRFPQALHYHSHRGCLLALWLQRWMQNFSLRA